MYLEDFIGDFFAKPLFTCPMCMSGVYSVVTYYFYYEQFDIKLIAFIPVTLCLSAIIHSFLETLKMIKEIAQHERDRTFKI